MSYKMEPYVSMSRRLLRLVSPRKYLSGTSPTLEDLRTGEIFESKNRDDMLVAYVPNELEALILAASDERLLIDRNNRE